MAVIIILIMLITKVIIISHYYDYYRYYWDPSCIMIPRSLKTIIKMKKSGTARTRTDPASNTVENGSDV